MKVGKGSYSFDPFYIKAGLGLSVLTHEKFWQVNIHLHELSAKHEMTVTCLICWKLWLTFACIQTFSKFLAVKPKCSHPALLSLGVKSWSYSIDLFRIFRNFQRQSFQIIYKSIKSILSTDNMDSMCLKYYIDARSFLRKIT